MSNQSNKLFSQMFRKLRLNPTLLETETGLKAARLRRWARGKIDLTDIELQRLGAAVDDLLIVRAGIETLPQHDCLGRASNGEAIKHRRRTWGITQSELARRSGVVSQATVSLFENGYIVLNPEDSKKLDGALAALVKKKRTVLNAGLAPFTRKAIAHTSGVNSAGECVR